MSDRALIAAAFRVQQAHGWSNRRFACESGVSRSTWLLIQAVRSPSLYRKTRAKLREFIVHWSCREVPPNTDRDIIDQACSIQRRRGWPSTRCAYLAGVCESTWYRIKDGQQTFLYASTREKVRTFVEAWSDDSRQDVDGRRRNGRPFQQVVTPEKRQAILQSSLKAQELAVQLGVSSGTVYRVRLRDRVLREAS